VGVFGHVGFFCFPNRKAVMLTAGTNPLQETPSDITREIAKAVGALGLRPEIHQPKSMAVVASRRALFDGSARLRMRKDASRASALNPAPVGAGESQGSRPMWKRNDDGFEGILFTGALT
jgi:hypothetical protein